MPKEQNALKALGLNVRKRRTALKLSQRRLAAKADLDRSYISDIERGIRNPSLRVMVSIAKALGTTLAKLLDGIHQ